MNQSIDPTTFNLSSHPRTRSDHLSRTITKLINTLVTSSPHQHQQSQSQDGTATPTTTRAVMELQVGEDGNLISKKVIPSTSLSTSSPTPTLLPRTNRLILRLSRLRHLIAFPPSSLSGNTSPPFTTPPPELDNKTLRGIVLAVLPYVRVIAWELEDAVANAGEGQGQGEKRGEWAVKGWWDVVRTELERDGTMKCPLKRGREREGGGDASDVAVGRKRKCSSPFAAEEGQGELDLPLILHSYLSPSSSSSSTATAATLSSGTSLPAYNDRLLFTPSTSALFSSLASLTHLRLLSTLPEADFHRLKRHILPSLPTPQSSSIASVSAPYTVSPKVAKLIQDADSWLRPPKSTSTSREREREEVREAARTMWSSALRLIPPALRARYNLPSSAMEVGLTRREAEEAELSEVSIDFSGRGRNEVNHGRKRARRTAPGSESGSGAVEGEGRGTETEGRGKEAIPTRAQLASLMAALAKLCSPGRDADVASLIGTIKSRGPAYYSSLLPSPSTSTSTSTSASTTSTDIHLFLTLLSPLLTLLSNMHSDLLAALPEDVWRKLLADQLRERETDLVRRWFSDLGEASPPVGGRDWKGARRQMINWLGAGGQGEGGAQGEGEGTMVRRGEAVSGKVWDRTVRQVFGDEGVVVPPPSETRTSGPRPPPNMIDTGSGSGSSATDISTPSSNALIAFRPRDPATDYTSPSFLSPSAAPSSSPNKNKKAKTTRTNNDDVDADDHPLAGIPLPGRTIVSATGNILPPVLLVAAPWLFRLQNKVQAIVVLACLRPLVEGARRAAGRAGVLAVASGGRAGGGELVRSRAQMEGEDEWMERVWTLLMSAVDTGPSSASASADDSTEPLVTVQTIVDEIARSVGLLPSASASSRALIAPALATLAHDVDKVLSPSGPVYRLLRDRLEAGVREMGRERLVASQQAHSTANPEGVRVEGVRMATGLRRRTAGTQAAQATVGGAAEAEEGSTSTSLVRTSHGHGHGHGQVQPIQGFGFAHGKVMLRVNEVVDDLSEIVLVSKRMYGEAGTGSGGRRGRQGEGEEEDVVPVPGVTWW